MTITTSHLDSDSVYGKRRQEMLALVNQLRAIGAQADLDLPRIAVIGNQSAGKSSLVEAISGISVPRDAGTCTRCPFECRLSQSSTDDAWKCQVSIRWEFDTSGRRQDEVREVHFGPLLTDPADVEMTLRRAQARVLNPLQPDDAFRRMGLEELRRGRPNQLKFSRNAVCVDISGPQLADLAFVDLPGIVANADDEVVQLVEELVKLHISGNCLILVALPMSDDIENQKAMRLARAVDPLGLRTIGVLTKPDLVKTEQQKSRWLDVVEGRSHPLKHGYYCTRQPDDDERANNITPAGARASEADFFLKVRPWARSTYVDRFGTQNLVMNLSRLLAKVINERLPNLSKETAGLVSECESRLSALPAPITSEPTSFVLGLVTAFCAEFKSYVEGHSFATTLVQDNRRTYELFRADIRSTAPRFLPFDDKKYATTYGHELFQLEENENTADMRSRQSDYITLKEVRERITKAITRELPNNVPYPAKVTFIRDFQRTWDAHVNSCAEAVLRSVQTTIATLISTTFGPYVNLEPKLTHAVNELIQAKYKEINVLLQKMLKFETSPFTQNEHYLESSTEKFLAMYMSTRSRALNTQVTHQAVPQTTQTVAQAVPRGALQVAPVTPNLNIFEKAVSTPLALSSSAPLQNTARNESIHPRQPSAAPAAENGCPGTLGKPWQVHREYDPSFPSVILQLMCISTCPEYRNWSLEELRAADAAKKRKVAPLPASATNGVPNFFGNVEPAIPPPSPMPILTSPLLTAAASTAPAATPQSPEDLSQLLAQLARLGFNNVTLEDLHKANAPAPVNDDYKIELEVMAEVRAYFKVAYKRVIDMIPLAIDHEFVYSLADALQDRLIQKLSLGSKDAAEKCAAYLAEDPHVLLTREELLSRKKRLERVQEELLNFGL